MLKIDGAQGEGGGQVLRTSLALSLASRTPIEVRNIRAGRRKPGLLRQHLTAVRAATAIGDATTDGAELRSTRLRFRPRTVRGGSHRFAVGTAGSAILVLQTVLPVLLTAGEPTELVLEGGTHNPFAPPFDFLAKAYVPLLERMGARLEVTLERPGFYPAGGGRLRVRVDPVQELSPLSLIERGEVLAKRARAVVAGGLPRGIADRELKRIRDRLTWSREQLSVEELAGSRGPGNLVTIEIESEHVTEVFTGFGERGRAAPTVADQAIDAARRYLVADVPVGPHLADQLLLPLALAGGGEIRTLAPTRHTETNIEVIRAFLDLPIEQTLRSRDDCTIKLG